MPTSSAVSDSSRVSSARSGAARTALTAAVGLGMLLTAGRVVTAQTSAPQERKWELRVSDGAFVPTGEQRSSLQNGHVTAAQLAWLVRPSVAVTGTFGWVRSRDVASIDAPKLDVFTSDVGLELRPAQWFAERAVTFSPFVGFGAGARSYNYRNLNVDATSNLAGYGSVGGELGFRRVGLRVEARDYATGFRPLVSGGRSDVRNDVVIMAALRFKRHQATQD